MMNQRIIYGLKTRDGYLVLNSVYEELLSNGEYCMVFSKTDYPKIKELFESSPIADMVQVGEKVHNLLSFDCSYSFIDEECKVLLRVIVLKSDGVGEIQHGYIVKKGKL